MDQAISACERQESTALIGTVATGGINPTGNSGHRYGQNGSGWYSLVRGEGQPTQGYIYACPPPPMNKLSSWLLLLLECAGLYKLNPCLEIYVIPYSANVGNQKRSQ
jgi:hypothetical protein